MGPLASPQRPHRVLFVDPSRALGGAEHSLLLLLEHLDRERFAPQLATRPGELAEAARARDVAVHEVPLRRLRGHVTAPQRLIRGAVALAAIVRRERIALLHANTLRALPYAGAAARLVRRPVVWHVRDLVAPGLRARALLALADAAVAVSEAAAARLPGPVRVIPNGVPLAAFSVDRRKEARALRRAWDLPEGAPLIGQVARLQPWKGQRHVLAAAELVLRKQPDAHFVLVGGDIFGDAEAYTQELHAEIERRGLGGQLRLVGHRNDVATVLAALDLVVHASRDEPFGRILIEAAAAGLPVVAFESGAVREIVVPEETGLLVPDGDERALAEGVLRLLGDRALTGRLGAAARGRAEERFDVRSLTRQLESWLTRWVAPR